MDICVFNTLSRKKEVFIPFEKGKLKIYSCGPTVYSRQHIGNLMSAITWDVLKRMFRYFGYEVLDVVNITDVGHLVSDEDEGEDKLEKSAKKLHKHPLEIAKEYEDLYWKDLSKLNVLKPKYTPHATEEIEEQIRIIKSLEENGFTYVTSDGVYFDTSKFKEYGMLSKQNYDEKSKSRIKHNTEKRNPRDFALWKFCVGENKNHILRWESPWGVGFPGWHIECSAMGYKYLGNKIDIHTGGIEHISVHHENEIAQNLCSNDSIEEIRYWMHNAHVLCDGQKMSKSFGNVYYLSDFEELGFHPLAYREVCFRTHYRKPLNFTLNSLKVGEKNVKKINEFYKTLNSINPMLDVYQIKDLKESILNEFEEAISDDLNMPQAIASLYKFISEFNRLDVYSKIDLEEAKSLIKRMDIVFGLLYEDEEIPLEVIELAKDRKKARDDKNFEEADKLREEIKELGYQVIDDSKVKEGYRLIRIK